MKAFLLSTLLWLTPAQAEPIDVTQVFFECLTADLVEEVAPGIGDLIHGLSELPSGCYWVYGERQANVLELIRSVYLPTGDIVWIGKVQRDMAPVAYSAGYIDEKMI